MTDWTAGYIADVEYTYGYYAELNPLRVKLAFLNAGLACPAMGTACELGFGQGLSANLHAAASVTRWHGTDFNPSQAGYAQELAAVSGAQAQLFDEAFADFAARTDLPEFDYIGLHGIWSWISDENRATITDFLRRKLKVGGVLYISYNTQPGWAAFAPMRHLLTEHAATMGAPGDGIVRRVDDAIGFAGRLLATNPAYAKANPQVAERVKKLQSLDRHYLAHEYFNRDWHPMHFAQMVEWLEPAKLSFACSANYLDLIDGVNLTNEQQTFLKEIADPLFRESVRDFMVNVQFRKDYWVKGPRKLSALEQGEITRAQKFILTTHRPAVPLKMQGAVGEAALSAEIYGPILDALADHQPKTLGQIELAMRDHPAISFAHIVQSAIVLCSGGHLSAVQDDAVIAAARTHSSKLNAYLLDRARGSGDITYLASPVTGGGVAVGRFQQIFMVALKQGLEQPADWAKYAWQLLSEQRQTIVKDGVALDSVEQNVAELTGQALAFEATQLPVLRALGII